MFFLSRRLTGIVVKFAIVTSISSCQSIDKDNFSFSQGLVEAIYGAEVGYYGKEKIKRTDGLTRWEEKEPIRGTIKVIKSEVGKQYIAEVKHHFENVYKEAGLKIEWVEDLTASRAQLAVVIRNSEDFSKITANPFFSCNTQIIPIGYSIYKARVFISEQKLSSDNGGCVVHEAMHSIGFHGHPHRLRSSLSYAFPSSQLTDYDKRMIAILYSADFPLGSSPKDLTSQLFGETELIQNESFFKYNAGTLEITEEVSPIRFNAPGLSGGYRKILYSKSDKRTRTTFARYAAKGGKSTTALWLYTRLGPRRAIKKIESLKRKLENMDVFRKQGLIINEKGTVAYQAGRGEYLSFSTQADHCVGFQHHIERRSYLFGYYCDKTKKPFTKAKIKSLLEGLTIRPKIDPSKN